MRYCTRRPAIIRHMGPYDELSPQQLARIRRFVEAGDIRHQVGERRTPGPGAGALAMVASEA